jgi:hypothetical protein
MTAPRILPFLLLPLVALAACGSGSIVGDWTLDTRKLTAELTAKATEKRGGNPSDEEKKEIDDLVAKAVGASRLAMTVREDGTWTAEGVLAWLSDGGGVRKMDGTWKAEGKGYVFRVGPEPKGDMAEGGEGGEGGEEEDFGRNEDKSRMEATCEGGLLTLHLEEGMRLPLRRK